MKNRWRALVLILSAVGLSACGPEEVTCPQGFLDPLVIEVRTAEGEPAGEGTVGVATRVRDGAEFELAGTQKNPELILSLSAPVDGTFNVRLTREGFEDWTRSGIVMEETRCGPQEEEQVKLQATLVRNTDAS